MNDLEMYASAFIASFLAVCLKSLQQQNVTKKLYHWIMPISLCMAVTEVLTVAFISKHGFGWLVLCIGIGSGLGAIVGVYIHDKITGESE